MTKRARAARDVALVLRVAYNKEGNGGKAMAMVTRWRASNGNNGDGNGNGNNVGEAGRQQRGQG